MGTPDFAVPSLEALVNAHDVALVVTQPDRRAGRGMTVRASPVAEAARAHGLAVAQPERARDPALAEQVRSTGAHVLVVAAYGQILPAALLEATPGGGLNVHASLLPRWRGASPITAAILAGDAETGVSIMRMEAGLDTGPVLLQRSTPIGDRETAGELGARLAALGAEALAGGLQVLAAGEPAFSAQDDAAATYAPLVRKGDGDLSWDRPAAIIDRAVRAYDPWPGVRLPLGGEALRVLDARALPAWAGGAAAEPGTVLEVAADGVTVMAADAPVRVIRVQPPGKRPMDAAAFARGRHGLAARPA